MTDRLRTSTYFALLAEFGTGELLLDDVAGKYFGLSVDQAKRRAAMNRLPVPAYRVAGQKSPWLISAADLAEMIERQREAARQAWERSAAQG